MKSPNSLETTLIITIPRLKNFILKNESFAKFINCDYSESKYIIWTYF